MADKTINDLTAATSLSDSDLLEIENTGNNSRKITATNARLYFGGGALIGTSSPAGGTTATFSSIPSTYSALKIIGVGRSDAAGTGTSGLILNFNSDGGANYGNQRQLTTSTTVTGSQSTAQTNMVVAELSKAGDVANLGSIFELTIPLYAGTDFAKTLTGSYAMFINTTVTSMYNVTLTGYWNSTAAINRIDLAVAGGNWVTGSKVMLYGIA